MLMQSVIGALRAVFGITRTGDSTIYTPGSSSGRLVVRQPGGVAGTDDVTLHHDGTIGHLINLDGTNGFIVADSGVNLLRLYRFGGIPLAMTPRNGMFAFSNADNNANGTPDTGLRRIATKVVGPTAGLTGSGWLQNTDGAKRLNSNYTNATTSFTNLADLTHEVIAGRKYAGRMLLRVDQTNAAEGVKLDFGGGTATWTRFNAAMHVLYAAGHSPGTLTANAISGAMNLTNISGVVWLAIEWLGVVNAAGTLIPRAAMNSFDAGFGLVTAYADSCSLVQDIP